MVLPPNLFTFAPSFQKNPKISYPKAEIMKKASCKFRMSADIPFEIQEEIMKRLPVKSLIQFRSVSKAWKSLIHSSDFIAHYNTQLQHLLVSYNDSVASKRIYVSIVDDDSFPQHKVCLTLPPLVNMLEYHSIVGISHGLLCLYGYYDDALIPEQALAVIWNISIRKAVAVVVPNVADNDSYVDRTVLGFGVCGETSDPKIVKLTPIEDSSAVPWLVEVFTLSTGVWRSPYSNHNLPPKLAEFDDSQVVIDGFLYWLAIDWSFTHGCNLVISFDMASEEFKEVNLPDLLAHETYEHDLCISRLRKSLVVLEHDKDEMVFIVWVMEEGVPKSFTNLFTIHTPDEPNLVILEFRKSGEPVIEYFCDGASRLLVYDSYSEHFNNLELPRASSYSMYAYMETLLLLDQPNFTIYNKGNRYIKNA